MVLKIFSALSGLAKVRTSQIDNDSHIFRLHYRLATSICFIACALVSATEYIGDPIQCMNSYTKVDPAVNTYCWIASTFTINTTKDEGHIDGLGHHRPEFHEKSFHAYYQWVPFMLFFQGCLFYLPHLFWKATERKTAEKILQGLDKFSLDPDIEKKKENIIQYLRASKGRNLIYSFGYHFFELLNFANVLGNIFFLDAFFGGKFMEYGTKVLTYALDDSPTTDHFRTVFPKVTKCTFFRYGPSGTLENIEPICILPQNIINEKIFVIMWFWLIILATLSGMQLVWRMVICLSPVIRVRLLEKRVGLKNFPINLERAIQRLHLGDFFLLDILGRNLDAVTFRHILKGSINEGDKDPNSNGAYPPMPSTEERIDALDAIGMNEITN